MPTSKGVEGWGGEGEGRVEDGGGERGRRGKKGGEYASLTLGGMDSTERGGRRHRERVKLQQGKGKGRDL